MALKRWDGAAYVDLTTLKRWDGAAWVDLTIAKRWDGAAWQDLAGFGGGGSGFSVTVSPGAAVGLLFTPEPASLFQTVTTSNVTASAAGGTGPYTYSWTYVSGSSAHIPSNPSGATTNWSATQPKNSTRQSVWRVTATDSLSATATADVAVETESATDL